MSVVQSRRDEGTRGESEPPAGAVVDRVLLGALEEDLGAGDLTTDVVVPAAKRARGFLVARESGVVCGLTLFARVFTLLDSGCSARFDAGDGDPFLPGDVVCRIEGSARALLHGERTALNVIQRLSGIATLTRAFVERTRGQARVLDTRKTTPGLRALEKYAVCCGGGENHRHGLYDEVMVKNNHVDLARRDLVELLRALRLEHGPAVRITAEARTEAEALAAVRGGADVVLLDNMAVGDMAALCPRLRHEARGRGVEIEASGGVSLDTIAGIAACGVDRISVGALTHSAPAIDLAFRLEELR